MPRLTTSSLNAGSSTLPRQSRASVSAFATSAAEYREPEPEPEPEKEEEEEEEEEYHHLKPQSSAGAGRTLLNRPRTADATAAVRILLRNEGCSVYIARYTEQRRLAYKTGE